MKRRLLLVSVAAFLFSGCQNVPTNTMTMTLPNGKKVEVVTQKNNAIFGFKLKLNPTTGDVEMSFDSWVGTNDPSIVQANTAGNTAQLQIVTKAMLDGVKTGAMMATNPSPTEPPVPLGLTAPRSIQLHDPTNWSKHEFDPTTNSAAH